MIVLYGNALSTYCAKVRIVLRYKSIDFEERSPPGGYGSSDYKRVVPMGSIPALVDGELVLSESEAIAEYLEERWPTPAMLPGDAASRARTRALSRIHDCWIEPQLRALYPVVKSPLPDLAEVRRRYEIFHSKLNDFAGIADASSYLAGETLTIADCAWPTTLTQAELLFAAFDMSLSVPQKLLPWRARLNDDPMIAPEVHACEGAMRNWLRQFGRDRQA